MRTASQPLVSVVIPTYNAARYVTEAVDSALAQTYSNIEVIVADDGSTDNTREILARYGDKVRILALSHRGQPSEPRNEGIRAARGDFIALLDADDRWRPGKLARQMALFDGAPEVGVVSCGWEAFDETGVRGQRVPCEQDYARILELLVTSNIIVPSSVVMRRRCLDQWGSFDESLAKVEDRELWIRLARHCTFRVVEDALVQLRLHPASHSMKPGDMERCFRVTLERAFADGPLKGRFLLRAKAHAFMHLDFSWVYHACGQNWQAWRHVALSLIEYPLPDWKGRIAQMRFGRWRRLMRYTLELLS